MDPLLVAEAAKLIIFGVTSMMEQAGLTKEEIDEVFAKSREKFLSLDPNNLPN